MSETWQEYKSKHPISPGLDTFYHWILFNCGFIAGEHFSDLLARQRERWGVLWYGVVGQTFAFILLCLGWLIYQAYKVKNKYVKGFLILLVVFTIGILVFLIWLFIHIISYIPAKFKKE